MTAPDRIVLRAQLADLLDADPTEIGDSDDLVDVGLDSIRLMTLVQRWQSDGIDVDLGALAECPTVENWERLLAAAAPEPEPLVVARVEETAPRRLVVTFAAGEPFARLAVGGVVTVLVPTDDGVVPRTYTGLYHPEHRELDVEVVLHGRGPGSRWAGEVGAGDEVGVLAGRVLPPAPLGVRRWTAVVDETGLSALTWRLARLPASLAVHALVEVADAAEQRELTSPAQLRVDWVHREDGGELPPLTAADAVWVAGGAELVERVRTAVGACSRVDAEVYWGG